jgi:hypothetical protein
VPNSLARFRNLQRQGAFAEEFTTADQIPGTNGNKAPANNSIYNNSAFTSSYPGPPAAKVVFPSRQPPPSTPPVKFAFPRPPPRPENFNLENVTGLNLSGETGGSKRTRRRHKRNKKNKKSRRSRR